MVLCLWNFHNHNIQTIHFYRVHIGIGENVRADLVTVDGIPQIRDDFMGSRYSLNGKPVFKIGFLKILLNSEQNRTANCIGKRGICFPKRLRERIPSFFTL